MEVCFVLIFVQFFVIIITKFKFTESINTFVITWLTFNKTAQSTVRYGLRHTNELQATGTVTEFIDGGPLKLKRYIHRVKLSNLQADTEYGESFDGLISSDLI